MRKSRVVAAATVSLLGAALAVPLAVPQAGAAPGAPAAAPAADRKGGSDNLLRPWQRKYEAERQAALQQRLRSGGTAGVERLARNQYARVEQTGTDRVFVVIAEFGGIEHSAYPDGESDAIRVNGPRHNQIPKPDRTEDNSTLWRQDYDRRHYENMYFNRMRSYFEDQSSGRYSIEGDVTEWVRVPFNQARYGRDYCGDVVCSSTWFLIRDAMAQWTQAQLDAGRTMPQIRRYLRTFDIQDRYDFDEDGDFRERDGYIDHFQIVHAGGDQADGDPTYGTDAIWSHRSYAQIQPEGTGPVGGAQKGGIEIGEGGVSDPDGANVQIPDNPTGVWAGDYTIQPENGGLGVFAHEYGHDLGLPDLYDTGGAENSTGFWTLMAQSRGTPAGASAIGGRAMSMGAWEKFQLGWLDYDVVRAGDRSEHKLRPNSSADTPRNDGLIVLLPNKHVQLELGDPCATCGERYFYSDSGDDIETTMTRAVDGGGALTAQVRYEIEEGFDYAFLEASEDGGETWTPIETNVSYTGDDQGGVNPSGAGISGTTNGAWVDLTATLPAGTDTVRFRYRTDSAVSLTGFQVDEIAVDGELIGTAEVPDEGWVFDGFRTTTGSEDQAFLNAYVVDNRQYVGNDRLLSHTYNLGFLDTRPDWVEYYHYEPGMLVSYWDTSHTDNNVGDHPGEGEVLPVDAHPTFAHTPDGALARPRILTYDSTFGLEPTSGLRLHYNSQAYRVPSEEAVPVFNDSREYWYDFDEHGTPHPGVYQPGWYSVNVPESGTRIRVVHVNRNGVMTVRVSAAR